MANTTNGSRYSRGQLSNELRMKIRKAQLRVTLDEQLGRTTPESAKKLAALPLPPLFSVPRQDESAEHRRTSDSESDGPTSNTSARALLSNELRLKILKARWRVTLDEELGRTTPDEVKQLAARNLPPLVRETRQHDGASDRQTSSSESDEPARGTSARALLSNELRLKILKAQLRVTLDEQLGRTTPESAKKMAELPLPTRSRVPRQDESAEHRRPRDPQNRGTLDRALLSNALRIKILKAQLRVTLDEQLGRTTPESAKKIADLPLPRRFRVPRQN